MSWATAALPGRGDRGLDWGGGCCDLLQRWGRGLQTPACFWQASCGPFSSLSREGLGLSEVTRKSGTPVFSVSSGSRAQSPTSTDSASLSISAHSFLTSLQEVTGTLVRSMPSITAILVLMFTCLCILSCGAGVEDGGRNPGRGVGNVGPASLGRP